MCRKCVQTPLLLQLVHLHRYKCDCGICTYTCSHNYAVVISTKCVTSKVPCHPDSWTDYGCGNHCNTLKAAVHAWLLHTNICLTTVMSEHTMFDVPSSSWWFGTTLVLLYSLWWGCILVWWCRHSNHFQFLVPLSHTHPHTYTYSSEEVGS